ncbi:NAD(P)H dehydrogenase (quinone) [Jatrophihabitans endophyticus]|uniref:NAD(P)H dehydrogenase (Quinone) n=1 Tax=Jatrophihabitans endophyticus TaxID=1206085 RepID=A0A1M5TV59_9ACTN|nr:NAD(P)H-binding protein [Jatrophihabitans endophyticus]SHH54667.1 NAD(P)H dehydrogenase (quinone) [Jatrophihabitans endophyticus]
MTTYAVTGASGQLGHLAAERLLQRVDASDVVLLSRDPAKLAQFADRGATVRAADFTRPETLADAFAGVDRLLLVSTDAIGERVAHHRAAIDAAVAAGVERIAYTSLPRPTADNPAGVVPDHAATEEYLRASGLGWSMLRNNLYADMQVDAVRQAAAHGSFVTNYGAGRAAFVTRADCAAAAVGALVSDTGDVVHDVTGPEAWTAEGLAGLASEVSGTQVGVTDLDDAAYAETLAGVGLPQPVVELVVSFGRSVREGFLADVTTAVRDLGGADATSLRDLVSRPGDLVS